MDAVKVCKLRLDSVPPLKVAAESRRDTDSQSCPAVCLPESGDSINITEGVKK